MTPHFTFDDSANRAARHSEFAGEGVAASSLLRGIGSEYLANILFGEFCASSSSLAGAIPHVVGLCTFEKMLRVIAGGGVAGVKHIKIAMVFLEFFERYAMGSGDYPANANLAIPFPVKTEWPKKTLTRIAVFFHGLNQKLKGSRIVSRHVASSDDAICFGLSLFPQRWAFSIV
jgi:hypothetical protein